jgi:hypothetical protein
MVMAFSLSTGFSEQTVKAMLASIMLASIMLAMVSLLIVRRIAWPKHPVLTLPSYPY